MISQAKSILSSLSKSVKDSGYVQILSIIKNNLGYAGLFVKLHYLHEVSIEALSQLYNQLINNKHLLHKIQISKIESLEQIQDQLESARVDFLAKKSYNQFPSFQKTLIKYEEDKFILKSLAEAKDADFFFKKSASYKDRITLINSINSFINNTYSFNHQEILKIIKRENISLIHQNLESSIVIVRVNDSVQLNKLASNSSWCIRESSTFQHYTSELKTQYICLLTDLDSTDKYSCIGFTLDIFSLYTAHLKDDCKIRYEELKDLLKSRNFNYNSLFSIENIITSLKNKGNSTFLNKESCEQLIEVVGKTEFKNLLNNNIIQSDLNNIIQIYDAKEIIDIFLKSNRKYSINIESFNKIINIISIKEFINLYKGCHILPMNDDTRIHIELSLFKKVRYSNNSHDIPKLRNFIHITEIINKSRYTLKKILSDKKLIKTFEISLVKSNIFSLLMKEYSLEQSLRILKKKIIVQITLQEALENNLDLSTYNKFKKFKNFYGTLIMKIDNFNIVKEKYPLFLEYYQAGFTITIADEIDYEFLIEHKKIHKVQNGISKLFSLIDKNGIKKKYLQYFKQLKLSDWYLLKIIQYTDKVEDLSLLIEPDHAYEIFTTIYFDNIYQIYRRKKSVFTTNNTLNEYLNFKIDFLTKVCFKSEKEHNVLIEQDRHEILRLAYDNQVIDTIFNKLSQDDLYIIFYNVSKILENIRDRHVFLTKVFTENSLSKLIEKAEENSSNLDKNNYTLLQVILNSYYNLKLEEELHKLSSYDDEVIKYLDQKKHLALQTTDINVDIILNIFLTVESPKLELNQSYRADKFIEYYSYHKSDQKSSIMISSKIFTILSSTINNIRYTKYRNFWISIRSTFLNFSYKSSLRLDILYCPELIAKNIKKRDLIDQFNTIDSGAYRICSIYKDSRYFGNDNVSINLIHSINNLMVLLSSIKFGTKQKEKIRAFQLHLEKHNMHQIGYFNYNFKKLKESLQ